MAGAAVSVRMPVARVLPHMSASGPADARRVPSTTVSKRLLIATASSEPSDRNSTTGPTRWGTIHGWTFSRRRPTSGGPASMLTISWLSIGAGEGYRNGRPDGARARAPRERRTA